MIGLLTFGGKIGNIQSTGLIIPHRDHSYSRAIPTKRFAIARTVNLGSCIFNYDGKDYQLNDGDIIEFNCKKLHGVTKIMSEERFSINLWQLNQQKGYFPIV
jgi:phage gp45-like